ncbi:MAG: aminotransferase class I/II-fold pyridoxal phosphate-dependent enzyme, partial [Bacteroidales bacterium]|nr:aminotransferase class I/II-fold pyridoxal phosphate-dependent enzyme [Bacteroidales bacterium]
MNNNFCISRIRPPFSRDYYSEVLNINYNFLSDVEAKIINRIKWHYHCDAVFFLGSFRQGLKMVLDSLALDTDDEILLPNFECPSILESFRGTKAKIDFFDLHCDFCADADQIKSMITEKTKVVMITHYFGKSCWTAELKQLLSDRHFILIEDCAHSLLDKDQSEIGSLGDIAIFSLGNDKPLSIGKGGILIINNKNYVNLLEENYNNLSEQKEEVERQDFSYFVIYSLLSDPDFCYFNIPAVFPENLTVESFEVVDIFSCPIDDIVNKYRKKLNVCNKNIVERGLNKINRLFFQQKEIKNIMPYKMSMFSKVQLLYAIAHLIDDANKKRKDNVMLYNKYLHSDNLNITQIRYNVLCHTTIEAKNMINNLRSKNIEVGLFNWSELLAQKYGVEHDIPGWAIEPARLINLPVHPFIDEKTIIDICQEIRHVNVGGGGGGGAGGGGAGGGGGWGG